MKEAEGGAGVGGVMREPVIRNCHIISFFFFFSVPLLLTTCYLSE